MPHFGEAAQQTSGTLIASLLHTNGLVNSPMELIATFKMWQRRFEGGVRGERTGLPRQAAINSAAEFLHLAPSSASLPRFRPFARFARHLPGIKLELAESSDMLITGLALL